MAVLNTGWMIPPGTNSPPLCWRTISTRGYHPPSIQCWHGYCVDTSAGELLVPGDIIHTVCNTAMVIVSIPLLGDNYYPGVSSTQYSVLAWLLCRYLCWRTISTRGYHPPSIQYWHGYCVDTSAGGLLVPGDIIHTVFNTGMVIVSIPRYRHNNHGSIEYWVDDIPGY
jgi:hypothetical protein